MSLSLTTLRQTAPVTPAQFLAAHPGCWIQYYDDTGVKDPAKALSARSFNVVVARRKQLQRCAISYSLQAFGAARTKECFLSFRNLGVDVDLVPAPERRTLPMEEIDRRKEAYLRHILLPFPLNSHWLVETRHGFHIVFRVKPVHEERSVSDALAINRRLVRALKGDENAVLLTQVLRVPGTFQFKGSGKPFLCRLLVNNAGAMFPYEMSTMHSVLDAWEVFHAPAVFGESPLSAGNGVSEHRPRPWLDRLQGVPQGQRNATATAIIGGIVGRLPEYLWETGGWGGLKEWNQKNAVPLSERELRSVFVNIARREHAKRRGNRINQAPEGLKGERSQRQADCKETSIVRKDVSVSIARDDRPHGYIRIEVHIPSDIFHEQDCNRTEQSPSPSSSPDVASR